MQRLLACALAGTVLLFTAACTGEEPPLKPRPLPRVTATGPVSPQSAVPDRGDVTEGARSRLLGMLPAKDLPGPAGVFTGVVAKHSALFVWRTGDERLCTANVGSGFQVRTCMPSADVPPFTSHPALVPVFTMGGEAEYHVIGADRETVVSVTCSGTPLEVHRLPRVLDTRRTLYVFEVPLQSVGRVTVTVDRAHATATEHANLVSTHPIQSRPVCR